MSDSTPLLRSPARRAALLLALLAAGAAAHVVGRPAPFERRAAALRARSVGPGLRLVTTDHTVRQTFSVSTSWEVDTGDLAFSAYAELLAQRVPELAPRVREEGRWVLFATDATDWYSLEVAPVGSGGRVRITFSGGAR